MSPMRIPRTTSGRGVYMEHGERFVYCRCGERAYFTSYCGAYLCSASDYHVGLARCFCGWARSGGNGYQELRERGEVIETDEY